MSTDRSSNAASPATAARVVVPLIVAPPGPPFRATVTSLVAAVTGVPLASTMETWTFGMTESAGVHVGCLRKTNPAGTCSTVIVAVDDTPSTAAVIVAMPFARAVTRPAASTDAIASSDDDQANVLSEMAFPFPSRAVAVSTTCSLTDASVVSPGETVTEEAGSGEVELLQPAAMAAIARKTVVRNHTENEEVLMRVPWESRVLTD